MIQMDDAGDPQLAALRELAQEESQGNRIGAAGQRDEHAGIRTHQIVRPDRGADTVEQLHHWGWGLERPDASPALPA